MSHIKSELDKAQKHRLKIEKVLKQASDSLVLALSVRKKFSNELNNKVYYPSFTAFLAVYQQYWYRVKFLLSISTNASLKRLIKIPSF